MWGCRVWRWPVADLRAQREACDDLDERVAIMKDIKQLDDQYERVLAKARDIDEQIRGALRAMGP
jgi:hypothetical protein